MVPKPHSRFHRMDARPRWIAATFIVLAACRCGIAQDDDAQLRFERGATAENVVSGADPSQRYAIFLPSEYERDRSAPVLLLMDPRGRAMIPMELFREAAEQFGFVVLSSYNTLSDADTAYAANDKALSAMLVDAQARFSVNPQRFYLVGFSGTAHYAWTIAPQLDGHLAGIMGVGGGLPIYSDPMQKALKIVYPFAFFATAGIVDFNFDGVRYLDRSLDSTRFAHRFVPHEGEHAWPPQQVAYDAVEWFHLQAMRADLVPRDDAFIERTRAKYLLEASALEASGRKADAYRRYREIVQDFEGLGGSSEAAARLIALENDRSVGREFIRRAQIAQRVIEYQVAARDYYQSYRKKKKLPSLQSALKKLDIEKLKKRTESDDREEAAAARRMLATAFVNTAFYEPRDYFRDKDYQRAAGMLRIAMAIRPNVPRVCYQLARADAQLGETEEALDLLQCGLKAEWATKELVESDELLDPLKTDPRFQTLIRNNQ